jgi:hypothetical protein
MNGKLKQRSQTVREIGGRPDTNYRWLEHGPICIDTDEGQPTQSDSKLPKAPAGSSVTWMYLGEMNRFLLFAGGHATLEWTGPEENRGR